jgi:hypothetical protein
MKIFILTLITLISGVAHATEKEYVVSVSVYPLGAEVTAYRNNLSKGEQEIMEDRFLLDIRDGCMYVKGYAARWPSGAIKESGDLFICDDEQHYTVNLRLPSAEQKSEDHAYATAKRKAERKRRIDAKVAAEMPRMMLEEKLKQRDRELNNPPTTTKCKSAFAGGFECTTK